MSKIKVVIPAYHVRERTQGANDIAQHVNHLLGLVEGDIEDAIENEQPYATTELDTYFAVPFMSSVMAQRKVYYHLTRTLTQANYTPRLLFVNKKAQAQRVFLYTTWKLKQQDAMDDYENQFLKSITITTPLAPIPSTVAIDMGRVGKKAREPDSAAFKKFLLKDE